MSQQDDHEPRTNRPFTTPDRPERGHRRKLPRLMLVLTSGGSLLLLGAILLVVWQVVAPQPTSGGNGTGSPGTGAGATKITQPEQEYPALYWQTIREQVAAGLHLTVDQLKAKLTTPTEQGPKGPTAPDISEVAMQQGIDAEHLRAIEIAAV
jgi:hypothetical protein